MEFKILDLFKYYFKNILLAAIVFVLTLVSCAIYIANGYEKEYVAKTTIMLGICEHTCEDDHLNIYFNQAVVKDYMELIKSNRVLDEANKSVDSKYSTSELKGMVNTYYEEETEYITIEATTTNKSDSAKLAYNIYVSLLDEVDRIFDVKNVHLVDTDKTGSLKYSDSFVNVVIIIIGLMLSFVATTIKFLFFPNFKLKNILEKVINFKNNKLKKEPKKNNKKSSKKNNKKNSKKKNSKE